MCLDLGDCRAQFVTQEFGLLVVLTYADNCYASTARGQILQSCIPYFKTGCTWPEVYIGSHTSNLLLDLRGPILTFFGFFILSWSFVYNLLKWRLMEVVAWIELHKKVDNHIRHRLLVDNSCSYYWQVNVTPRLPLSCLMLKIVRLNRFERLFTLYSF